MSEPNAGFCFPVRRLENSRVILEPFDLATHAELFVQGTQGHPEVFAYRESGPFSTAADFEAFYNARVESTDTENLYAILAKSDEADEQGVFAGTIALENASPANARIEIGNLAVLPAFQRTAVATNAVGLLLLYALDPPPHGLGLRRCQWQAHVDNAASRRLAAKVLFSFEGVLRFQRVVPSGKAGNGFDAAKAPSVEGVGLLGPSRDTALFAHYCDEWDEKKGQVLAIMERRR